MSTTDNLISAYMASIAKKRWKYKTKEERSVIMKRVRRGEKLSPV